MCGLIAVHCSISVYSLVWWCTVCVVYSSVVYGLVAYGLVVYGLVVYGLVGCVRFGLVLCGLVWLCMVRDYCLRLLNLTFNELTSMDSGVPVLNQFLYRELPFPPSEICLLHKDRFKQGFLTWFSLFLSKAGNNLHLSIHTNESILSCTICTLILIN